MWSVDFWKATAERAIKTFAQVLGATLIAAGTDLLNTDWTGALSIAGMATVLSLLTSLASGWGGGGPSAIDAEVIPLKGNGKHAA